MSGTPDGTAHAHACGMYCVGVMPKARLNRAMNALMLR
jgi:hypothetical protein